MKNYCEFELKLHSDNDAFREDPESDLGFRASAEVARILRETADDIAGSFDYCEGNLKDTNGNTVGSFIFELNRDS